MKTRRIRKSSNEKTTAAIEEVLNGIKEVEVVRNGGYRRYDQTRSSSDAENHSGKAGGGGVTKMTIGKATTIGIKEGRSQHGAFRTTIHIRQNMVHRAKIEIIEIWAMWTEESWGLESTSHQPTRIRTGMYQRGQAYDTTNGRDGNLVDTIYVAKECSSSTIFDGEMENAESTSRNDALVAKWAG